MGALVRAVAAAPHFEDGSASEPIFERCAELFTEMQTTGRFGKPFNILSMGTSIDFEQAIKYGANISASAARCSANGSRRRISNARFKVGHAPA